MVSAALKTHGRPPLRLRGLRPPPAHRRATASPPPGRLVELVRDFRFTGAEVDFLRKSHISTRRPRNGSPVPLHRRHRRLRGGELFFRLAIMTCPARSPSAWCWRRSSVGAQPRQAIAAAAARMVTAARGGRSSRWAPGVPTRTPPSPPPGRLPRRFRVTSNLAAGARFAIPTPARRRTRSRCCTTTSRAFASQWRPGQNTTLLVDTYDIAQGIRNAIAVAGRTCARSGRLGRPVGARATLPRAARLARATETRSSSPATWTSTR